MYCCGYVAKSVCAAVCICMYRCRFLGVVHMYNYGYIYICVVAYMSIAVSVW